MKHQGEAAPGDGVVLPGGLALQADGFLRIPRDPLAVMTHFCEETPGDGVAALLGRLHEPESGFLRIKRDAVAMVAPQAEKKLGFGIISFRGDLDVIYYRSFYFHRTRLSDVRAETADYKIGDMTY
jgi:hypothetical protein